MSLKITTWNLEHANRLVSDNPNSHMVDRRLRVRETIEEIAPDILCIQEGPKGEQAVDDFCTQVFDREWVPILLDPGNGDLGEKDKEYQTKGTQWIWFLVKPELAQRCRLQSPQTWQAFVGSKTWPVNYWGEEKKTNHSHYRHPQVLIYDLGNGHELELIAVHLKSKINREKIIFDEEDNLVGDYLSKATQARIKLATEARNIRHYVQAKFEQIAEPAILVMGDCNDGPGHDYFETQYLFFDLISNLQGDVMIAERFFNHALFDFSGHLSWTAEFSDPLRKLYPSRTKLLLDHILISQPLCRGELPLEARAHSGLVEHEAFERANAGSNSKTITSDHRPVTIRLEDVT